MSSGSGQKVPAIKKAQMIRYSDNITIELSRLLGAYAYFLTNSQYPRAFNNMNSVIEHMLGDVIPDRIWQSFQMVEAKLKLEEVGVDYPMSWLQFLLDGQLRKKLFYRYKTLFQSLFGTAPSLDGKFSFKDLRPRVRPKPEDNIVFINRRVKWFDVWGRYDYDYLTNTVGFVTVQNKLNAAGFPVQIEKPLFSFTDKNITKKWTFAIPYVEWSQEDMAVTSMLIVASKRVELLAAFYVHMEGMKIGKIQDRGFGPRGNDAMATEFIPEGQDQQGGYDSYPAFNDNEDEGYDDY